MKVERICDDCKVEYIGGFMSHLCPKCRQIKRNHEQELRAYKKIKNMGILPKCSRSIQIKSTLIRYSDKGGFKRWKEDRGY